MIGSDNIIDGKKIAENINEENAEQVAFLTREHNLQPCLAVILIGNDPASKVYVNMKAKKCAQLGILSHKHVFPEDAKQEEILELVFQLNKDRNVHGILVQSPPPSHIDESVIVNAIDPKKDVDCFHAENVGKMLLGKRDGLLPCTPYGIMVLMERTGIDPEGKHVVIVGRSNIVGKPLMALLVQKAKGANATVTVCHSRTRNLPEITRRADILIAAIGKPGFIVGEMIKEGAVVIDVGVNRVSDEKSEKGYKLVGDVMFEEAVKKASKITPVPGGVGPMTIAMLMHNTIKACKIQYNIPGT